MLIENCVIIKSTAGFYYVKEPSGVVTQCRARGLFRKLKITPLVGDVVSIEKTNDSGAVVSINPRRNSLSRPNVANIDKLVILSSVKEPAPNLYIIDKMTAEAVYNKIEPVVVFSKADLSDASHYVDIYKKARIKSFSTSCVTGEGIEELKKVLRGCSSALTGNTGVGKSSVLNKLLPGLSLPVNEISDKLGRGKHTTRTVELYDISGGLVADTPGFSSLDFENSKILKEDLEFCFPEFSPYIGKCKFVSCAHVGEKGCAVSEASENGDISETRLKSYRMMYDEVKDHKEWENNTPKA